MTFELQEIAGNELGINIPQIWTDIQKNLKIPFDNSRQIHLEYDGYSDEEIKQVTLFSTIYYKDINLFLRQMLFY